MQKRVLLFILCLAAFFHAFASSPLQLDITASPDPVSDSSGTYIDYVIAVSNTGSDTLENVSVNGIVPNYTEVNYFSEAVPPTANNDGVEPGGSFGWNLGTMSAGSSTTILLPLYVDSPSNGNPASGSNIPLVLTGSASGVSTVSATLDVPVNDTPVLALAIAASNSPVAASGTLQYTLNYGNQSTTSIAYNTTLQVPVPAGTTFISRSAGGAVLTNGTLQWNLGTLNPGQNGVETFAVTLNYGSPNGAIVSANAQLSDSAEDLATAGSSVPVEAPAVLPLQIAFTASPDSISDNSASYLDYIITVTNAGSTTLDNVSINGIVPDYTKVNYFAEAVPPTENNNGVDQGNPFGWNLGTMAAGSSTTLLLPLYLESPNDGEPASGSDIPLTLTGSAPGISTVTASVNVPINNTPVLSLAVAANNSPVAASGTIQYTLNYGNQSTTSIAYDTTLEVPVPAGSTLNAQTAAGAVITNGTLQWNLGALDPGQNGAVSFAVTVSSSASNGAIIAANAQLADNSGDLATAASSVPVEAQTYAPLDISITASPDPVSDSSATYIDYIITVTNAGSTTLENVSVNGITPNYTRVNYFAESVPPTASSSGEDAGGSFGWNLGTMPAGGSTTILFPLYVDSPNDGIPASGSDIPLTLTGSASGMSTVTASLNVPLNNTPVLSLAVAASNSPVAASGTIQYTLNYGNQSTSSISSDAILQVPLPAGATLVPGSAPGAAITDGTLEWNLGTLNPGQIGLAGFAVTVNSGAANGTIVTANAQLSDNSGDLATAASSVPVEAPANSPLQVSITALPDPVSNSSSTYINYIVTVTNAGSTTLENVSVNGITPNYTRVNYFAESVPPTASSSGVDAGGSFGWNLGAMPAGSSVDILFPLYVDSQSGGLPAAGSDIPLTLTGSSPGISTVAASVDVPINNSPVLNLSLSSNPSPVVAGGTITYTLNYGNISSSSISSNVILQASVPAGTTLVSGTASGAVITNGTLQWNVGTLNPGQNGMESFAVAVGAGQASGSIITANSEVTDTSGDFATAASSTPVDPLAQLPLQVSIAAAPNPFGTAIDSYINYIVTVTNAGSTTLENVSVNGITPNYTRVNYFSESVPPTASSSSEDAGGSFGWNLGAMAAGSTTTILFPLYVDNSYDDLPPGGEIIPLRLTGSASGISPVLASLDTTTQTAPVLNLAASANAGPVAPGQTLEYTLAYGNISSGIIANDAYLQVPLPEGTTFISASDAGSYNSSTGLVEWPLGTLAPGVCGQVEFQVTVANSYVGTTPINAYAYLDDNTGDFADTSVDTPVLSGSPLSMQITATPNPAQPGGFIDYTINVINSGAVSLQQVNVSGVVPNFTEVNGDFASATPPTTTGGSISVGGTFGWNLGTIVAGGSSTILLPLYLEPTYDTSVPNGTVIPFTLTAKSINSPQAVASLPVLVDTNSITGSAGSFGFSQSSYSVNEGAGSITITVNRASGSAGSASVYYQTSDGSAYAGIDYTATYGTLNFASGQTTATFSVPITNEGISGGSKTFSVTLSDATLGATVGSPSSAIVTISGLEPSFTITPIQSANGTVSPNIAQSVTSGSSITFTATPDTGYSVNQWLLDGTAVQSGGTGYTLADVQASHTVEATFSLVQTYTITPVEGANGTISPNTIQVVTSGSSVLFSATPDTGYTVYQWLLDGNLVQTGGTTCTLNDVRASHTLEVTFDQAIPTYTITPTQGPNGAISPDTAQLVTSGSSIEFTAIPDSGYQVDQWLLNGNVVQTGSNPTYILSDVTASGTVNVTFAPQVVMPLAGTYDGLFANSGGHIAITLASNKNFTGIVTIGTVAHAIKGRFSSSGQWQGDVAGNFITLQENNGVAGVPGSYSISGTVNSVSFTAWHAVYAKGQSVAQAGKYFLDLTPSVVISGLPNPGLATLTVGNTGAATLAGKLPDGEAFKASATLVGGPSGNQCIIYSIIDYANVIPKGTRGFVIGSISFPSGVPTGPLTWTKPAQTKGKDPAAVDVGLTVAAD